MFLYLTILRYMLVYPTEYMMNSTSTVVDISCSGAHALYRLTTGIAKTKTYCFSKLIQHGRIQAEKMKSILSILGMQALPVSL